MKKLNVEVMGLQEMSHNEMVKTEGGIIPLIVAIIVVATAASCGGGSNNNNTNSNNTTINVQIGTTGDNSQGSGSCPNCGQ